ncbi:MAG: hypothetical protein WDZ59_04550 [Pirellulales bacterium]
MENRLLHIYLDDHIALMVAEMELAARCGRSNRGTPLAQFLEQLQKDVAAQKQVAEGVLRQTGGRSSLEGRMKQSAAWFAEKLGRLKLNGALLHYSALSRVLELETLSAAAQQRIAVWENCDAVQNADLAMADGCYARCRQQAQQHLEELIGFRRLAASWAFGKGSVRN